MLSEAVRIRFTETGRLKFISHLDLARTFRSAFLRAGIPVKYSEGYNPRQKMTFALTVSVGSESVCEFLDIKLTAPMEKDEFISRLRGALTSELYIIDAYEPQNKMTELSYAAYEIMIDRMITDGQIEEALASPMNVTRHTKSGDKTEDIRWGIKSAAMKSPYIITVVLKASQSLYLGADYFVNGIEKFLGVSFEDYSVKRVECYKDDMSIFR